MLRRLALLLLLWAPAAPSAAAQQRECGFTSPGTTDRQLDLLILHTRFEVTCSDGVVLRADSGTLYIPTSELTLAGNVYFQDPTRTLTSGNATYSKPIGRLYATDNVVFTDRAEGMTLRGPELEYFTALPPARPDPQVNAGQRPHLTLLPKDRGNDTEPLEVDGDRMALAGRNDLSVFGNVVIARPDMKATAGQAVYSGGSETLDLRNDAAIRSDEFTLRGEEIHALMPGGALESVDSQTHASLEGKDLTLTASELHLAFRDSRLQRTVARGTANDPRPLALSRTFRLEADSLEAQLPDQKLERVVAVGNARGESIDSATAGEGTRRPPSAPLRAGGASDAASDSVQRVPAASRLAERDWIVGDTITGYFRQPADSARAEGVLTGSRGATPAPAARDTAVQLERIVARGAAQSLYRLEQRADSARAPVVEPRKGINFLAGDVIDLRFSGGELATASVEGLKKGLYLDPDVPTATPAAGAGTGPVAPPNGAARTAPPGSAPAGVPRWEPGGQR